MKNILGYYLMPHPPLIIPSIGKGEEKKIQNTINACESIGKEISILKPETIVVITPHATMFSDAIAISNEEKIKGNLIKFRDFETNIELEIDKEFNDELLNLCKSENISAAGIDSNLLRRFNKDYELDHGTMVPMYFINKYYTDYKLVHITYSILNDIELYKFGMAIQKTAKNLNKNTVIIASGDLSHRLTEEGPYEYLPQGAKFDKELIENLENGNVVNIFNMDKCMIEEAGECGLRSLYILLGAMEGNSIQGELLSYEGPFGVGYGVMKFKQEGENISNLDKLLKIKEESFNKKISNSNPYVKLARESLNYYFKYKRLMIASNDLPREMLEERHGVFVSLKKFGQLRGCIGTIFPTTDCVANEIIRNAIQAAIADPRFLEVTEDELVDIDISVDVLTNPIKAIKEELNPKIYGVIVSKGQNRGLLLPDLEGVDTVEEQLNIACQKGGIDPNSDYSIEKFEVIRYKEGKNNEI